MSDDDIYSCIFEAREAARLAALADAALARARAQRTSLAEALEQIGAGEGEAARRTIARYATARWRSAVA
jgi:hypothetical protein